MLTGDAFFIDRDEGLVWCDSCAPAEVVHLAGRNVHEVQRGGPAGRYVTVESGELLVHWISLGGDKRARVRARCHVCGACQPPASRGRA